LEKTYKSPDQNLIFNENIYEKKPENFDSKSNIKIQKNLISNFFNDIDYCVSNSPKDNINEVTTSFYNISETNKFFGNNIQTNLNFSKLEQIPNNSIDTNINNLFKSQSSNSNKNYSTYSYFKGNKYNNSEVNDIFMVSNLQKSDQKQNSDFGKKEIHNQEPNQMNNLNNVYKINPPLLNIDKVEGNNLTSYIDLNISTNKQKELYLYEIQNKTKNILNNSSLVNQNIDDFDDCFNDKVLIKFEDIKFKSDNGKNKFFSKTSNKLIRNQNLMDKNLIKNSYSKDHNKIEYKNIINNYNTSKIRSSPVNIFETYNSKNFRKDELKNKIPSCNEKKYKKEKSKAPSKIIDISPIKKINKKFPDIKKYDFLMTPIIESRMASNIYETTETKRKTKPNKIKIKNIKTTNFDILRDELEKLKCPKDDNNKIIRKLTTDITPENIKNKLISMISIENISIKIIDVIIFKHFFINEYIICSFNYVEFSIQI